MKPKRYIVAFVSFAVCLCVLGIGLIIAGSLSFRTCKDETEKNASVANGGEKTPDDFCASTEEADRVELHDKLEQVMEIYYSLYPNRIVWHPFVGGEDIKRFRPYNCSPSALKHRTKMAKLLFGELKQVRREINESLLKPRELKSLIQMLHFLKSNFGHPYGENYYAGDWMMGPSRFCHEGFCRLGSELYYHFNTMEWSWQPSSYDDVTYLLEQLRGHGPLVQQYIANMKYGIQAGMVRSTEQCEAGYYSFVNRFQKVSAFGEKGILQEWFTKDLLSEAYFEHIEGEDKQKWLGKFNKTIQNSINTTLVEYVGKPLSALINYLKYEYSLYCVPSNVSSGLATLPLKYVYVNGSRTSQRTTQRLPFGEKLNGSKAYESVLYFFTTSENLTADKIHELGKEQLNLLYPEAVNVAENETGGSGQDAVNSFKKILDDQSSFFNDEAFPANESDEAAFTECRSLEKAKTSCPKRYEAFQKWSAFVREILSMLEPKTINMFHFTGKQRTTPSCPLKVVPNFNPKTGSQSFRSSGHYCTTPSSYRLPFFMDNLGPKYNAFSVAGHEGRPGHHTQLQGNVENFNDECDDSVTWINNNGYYPLFTEGWALYAENPLLARGTDIYENNLLQKYGMLKWQIWRALRLIVDTGLHYKGMKRYEALAYHAKYAWDTTDKATKDVTRYQSNPGQATAYMIGQLEIWNLRKLTKRKLEEAGKKFNEKDFHFQVLSQGMSPMEYLKIHINKYIECVVSGSKHCDALATGSKRGSDDAAMRRNSYKKMYSVESAREEHERFD